MYLSISACFRHSHVILSPKNNEGSISILYPLNAFVDIESVKNVSLDNLYFYGTKKVKSFWITVLSAKRCSYFNVIVLRHEP